MKQAGEERIYTALCRVACAPNAGGLTVKYHSDTRQAPDAETKTSNGRRLQFRMCEESV